MRLWDCGSNSYSVRHVPVSPLSDTFRIRSVGTQIGWFWLSKVWRHSNCGLVWWRLTWTWCAGTKASWQFFPPLRDHSDSRKGERRLFVLIACIKVLSSRWPLRWDGGRAFFIFSLPCGRHSDLCLLSGRDKRSWVSDTKHSKHHIWRLFNSKNQEVSNKPNGICRVSTFPVLMLSRCLSSEKLTQFDLKLILHV